MALFLYMLSFYFVRNSFIFSSKTAILIYWIIALILQYLWALEIII